MRITRALLCAWAPPLIATPLLAAGCIADDAMVASDSDGPALVTIGPSGGMASSSDGIFTIVFPPGALSESIEIEISETFDASVGHIGPAFRVKPDIALNMELQGIYRYTTAIVGDRDEQILTIGIDQGGFWNPLERTALDTATKRVTAVDTEISFNYGLVEDSSLQPPSETTSTDGADETTTSDGADTSTGDTTAGDTTAGDTTTGSGTTGSGGTSSSTGTSSGSETTASDGGPDTCGDGDVDVGEVCLLEGFSVASGAAPSAVKIADFDGDGDLDLAIASDDDDEVDVRLGTGTGFFLSPDTLAVGGQPTDLVIADFDGDGQLDIVTANAGSSDVSLLVGAGDGSFNASASFNAGLSAVCIDAGAFDAGVDLDIVVGGESSASLLLDDVAGFGMFDLFATGAAVTDIAAGNFDAGALDIVVTGAGN
ncbi:MAG: VCBS repeat-containing protein, partial [Nannocystaceae bacterium]|nr:VCBS repeat-containing protein [Nannocystaceae bacterium]